ncbi:MAG: hypothetical protein J6A83_09215 [Clostridia bacterium]|nr:hypothetical protein [Clostridia bacterium]
MRKIFCLILSSMILCGMSAFSASAADYTVNLDSPLSGVSVGFYGDSICAAGCEKNTDLEYVRGWAGRIGYTNDMDWINHGISAYSVSTCRGSKTIMSQLEKSEGEEHEMIILHGGTNDAWDNAPVGEMTGEDEFENSNFYNPRTFAGGLEQMFAFIEETNPDAVVGYIINFKFVNATNGVQVDIPDGNGGTKKVYRLNHMEDYVEMTKKICDKWGVPYLDLYSNDELTNKLYPMNGGTYSNAYVPDFVHPNTAGYDIIYPYIEEFMIDILEASQVTEATTTLATTPAPTPTTVPETTAEETAETKPGGCGAVMGSASVAVFTALGATAILATKKRKTR